MRARINGGIIGSYQTPSTSLTSTNRSAGEAAQLTAGGVWPGSTVANPALPPTITSVVITDSNYNALDDTAVNTAGGYMRILGTNFAQNPQLYFNGTLIANSWVSSSEVRVQLPSNSAGTGITFMLFNTTTSGGTIYTTGRTYSGFPSVTNSTPITLTATAISVQFVGTGDSPFVFSSTNAPAGTTLSSSGLLTGTLAEGTYAFSVTVDDAQLQTTTQSYSLTVSLADPYWYTVGLALTANSSVTGNTFIADYSLNNAELTVAGDTRASPYTPYQTGYYSNNFAKGDPGSYLTFTNSNLDFGSNNFTAECWIYPIDANGTDASFMGVGMQGGSASWRITWGTASLSFATWSSGTTVDVSLTTSSGVSYNVWSHVAITRSGSTFTVWINGVSAGTATSATAIGNTGRAAFLNYGYSTGAARTSNIYLSNVRWVNGTALYTSTFTPSTTPLLPVANTVLLTCQGNRFIDAGPLNIAITPTSSPVVYPAHPFAARYDYGTPYYSTYFDGTGDYLTLPSSASLTLSGDFTVEFWAYATVTSNSQTIWAPASPAVDRSIQVDGTSTNWIYYDGTANRTIGSYVLGVWAHIAIVRSGTTVVGYKNGVQGFSVTDSGTLEFSAGAIGYRQRTAAGQYFNGYISNFRIVKGQALYTSTFTPATSPLTTTSQGATASTVSVLTCQDATLIDNSTNALAITSNGDARPWPVNPFATTTYSAVSTVLPTYGSGYFDGTGDYLTVTGSSFATTGDFTVECWAYVSSAQSGNYGGLFSMRDSSTGYGISITLLNTNYLEFAALPGGTYTSTATPFNQWFHVALVRSGSSSNNVKCFFNGAQVGTISGTATTSTNSGAAIIGRYYVNGTSQYFLTGYVSNLRYVGGTALYTANFYPVLTPLTNTSVTQLLTLQYNGASNTSQIRDASNFQNLITRAGNANQGTFAPFRTPGHWSVYFNGSSDYLSITTTSVLALGSGNFTVECWIYPTSVAIAQNIICDWRTSNDNQPVWYLVNAAVYWRVNQTQLITAGTIVANTWTHLAMVKNSTTLTLYINGVSTATASDSVTYATDATFQIGKAWSADYWNGYISNLRIVKGTALYTTTFTPSTTPLRWVTNTSLLTCQDSAFIDNGNNFAITRNGSASVRPTSPFTIGTYTPTSYSVYFDGTGDYLSTTLTAQAPGTGNFTYECWFYITSLASGRGIMNTRSGDTTDGFDLAVGTNGAISASYSFTTLFSGTAGAVVINTWYHIAIVRTGGTTITVYLNGVSQGNFTAGGSQNYTSTTLYVGATALAGVPMLGYISNFRYINGTALYTTTFTPGTSQLTAVSGTQFLSCRGTSVTDNSSNAFAVTVNGNAVPARHNPFGYTDTTAATAWSPTTGGGSVYFDGTGDYLTSSNSQFAMGTGSFTWEAWVYPVNFSAWRQVFSTRTTNSSVTTSGSLATTLTTGVWCWYTNTFIINASVAPTLNAWNHVAVVRNGTAMAIYNNGVLVGTATNSDNLTLSVFTIGANNDGSEPWLGYISGVRVVKGTAVYTTSFLPATAPATGSAYTNTVLLQDANPSVTDWSMNNNLETVGDAKLSNQTPYAGSYYSNYFDGNADYLTVPSNASNPLGTTYTIECWHYRTGTASSGAYTSVMQLACTNAYGSTVTGFMLTYDGGSVFNFRDSSSSIILSYASTNLALNTWYHVAVVRNGSGSNNMTMYINGVSVATGTSSGTQTTQTAIYIGGDGSANCSFPGYISNFRITKGQALYTANFTPATTPLTTTSQSATASNVSLLTCQSRTFIDNSTNALTLTRNGDTAVKVQNPFTRITDYSVYFDGTGDYLVTPNNPGFAFGTGDFTVECWVYCTTFGANGFLVLDSRPSSSAVPYTMGVTVTGLIYIYDGTTQTTASSGITLNSWAYLTWCRSSSTLKMFVNGVSVYSASYTSSMTGTGSLTIGGLVGGGAGYFLNGYMTELRISKYARYTGTFTPNTTSDQFKVR